MVNPRKSLKNNIQEEINEYPDSLSDYSEEYRMNQSPQKKWKRKRANSMSDASLKIHRMHIRR